VNVRLMRLTAIVMTSGMVAAALLAAAGPAAATPAGGPAVEPAIDLTALSPMAFAWLQAGGRARF
jgi:hypothetical protein